MEMARRSGISPHAKEYVVQSFTDSTLNYTVTEKASPGRPWMCDCKAWIFARFDASVGRKKDCKHIRSVLLATKGTPMVKAAVAHPAGAKVSVDGEAFRVRRPEPKFV
jgi:hypothetical protein